MNSYVLFKVLHVLSAFTLVGPLVLTPRWLHLARHDVGRSALHDLHKLTGVSGWLVLLSGGMMLLLQHGAMLSYLWMQFSIVLYVAIQIFDNFWADRREDEIEHDPGASISSLRIWLFAKLGGYFLIAILMVLRP